MLARTQEDAEDEGEGEDPFHAIGTRRPAGQLKKFVSARRKTGLGDVERNMNCLRTRAETGADFLDDYEISAPVVFSYLYRACSGERQRAEDLTQETYAAALAAWRRGTAEATSVPYLLTIARNKMIDGYRKMARDSCGVDRLARRGIPTDDDLADNVANRETVLACLRRLPPMQRAVVALRFVDDLSLADTAAAIGKRLAAVESLQRRALANIRTMLEDKQ
jgi:RNA polymerase sigma-70 factor (ECF subfamily)